MRICVNKRTREGGKMAKKQIREGNTEEIEGSGSF